MRWLPARCRPRNGRGARGSRAGSKPGSISGGEEDGVVVEAEEARPRRQPRNKGDAAAVKDPVLSGRSRGRGRGQVARAGRDEKPDAEVVPGPSTQQAQASPALAAAEHQPVAQAAAASSTPYAWGTDLVKEVESLAQLSLASEPPPPVLAQQVDALTSFDPVAPAKPATSENVLLVERVVAVERPQSAAVARSKSAQSQDSLPSGVLSNGIPALPADLSLDMPPAVAPPAQQHSQASTGYASQPPLGQAVLAYPGTAFGGLLWGQPGTAAANVWQQPPPLQPQPQQQPRQDSFFAPAQVTYGNPAFQSQPNNNRGSLASTPPLTMPQFGTFGQMGGFGQGPHNQFGQFGSFGQSPFVPTGKQPDWSVPGNPIAPSHQAAAQQQGQRSIQQGFPRTAGIDSFLPQSFTMPGADGMADQMGPPGLSGGTFHGINGQRQVCTNPMSQYCVRFSLCACVDSQPA